MDSDIFSGRLQVHLTGLYADPVGGITDLQVSLFGQQRVHHAFMVWVQVLNDDKGHVAVRRHVRKKVLQGLHATG